MTAQLTARFAQRLQNDIIAQNPLWLQVGKQQSLWTGYLQRATLSETSVIQRKCISRLYARRILEVAAASAAYARSRTSLQEAIQKPPSQWDNFEQKDWTEELIASLGHTVLERAWLATKRLVTLGVLVSPMLVLTPLSYTSKFWDQFWWDYSKWGIEQAGPTFIKFVQWATTRQDMFSPQFCSQLSSLRDQTRGHAWSETEKLMRAELGEDWRSLVQIDDTPIGSGCIAQVYKGTLLRDTPHHPKSTEIAVKVQHPNIWDKVCIDFYILGKVASFLESLPGSLDLSNLSLRDSVDQFCNIMLPQLDLTLEASHLKRFNRDFSGDPRVHFPIAIDELTSPKILTETFCHGKPILSYLNAPEHERKDLAYLGLQTTLKMIFLHDFVHGDLHPGNILVDKQPDGKLNLVLLDCGLVIEMGPAQHENVVKILGAFTRRDGLLAGQLMVERSRRVQATPEDVQLFIQGINQICLDDANQNFVEHVGDYIADICYLACKHKVKLEAAFINASLAVEIIEGIASALYPDIKVSSTAVPLVVKAEMMHRFGWK
jgi:aarF domain-containing kinase